MRFTYWVIGRKRKPIGGNAGLYPTYYDDVGYWCENIAHAKKYTTLAEATQIIQQHQSRWATVYDYYTEAHEACDY